VDWHPRDQAGGLGAREAAVPHRRAAQVGQGAGGPWLKEGLPQGRGRHGCVPGACRELRCTDPLQARAGGCLACQGMLELPGAVQGWREPTGPACQGPAKQNAAQAAASLNAPAPNGPAGASLASMRQWRQWRRPSSGAAQTWQTPTGPSRRSCSWDPRVGAAGWWCELGWGAAMCWRAWGTLGVSGAVSGALHVWMLGLPLA